MKSAQWEQLKQLFERALESGHGGRDALMERVCREDPLLGRELQRLLEQHDRTSGSSRGFVLDDVKLPNFSALTHSFKPGDVVGGRYEVLRFIGQGGVGEVYEVRDLDLGGTVALKTLRAEYTEDPSAVVRFKREIQLARRVTHPNVCRVFDVGRHRATGPEQPHEIVFFTMELVEGDTLTDYLRENGRMPAAELPAVANGMARALAALHEANLVHRDFKPGNIMLPAGPHSRRVVVTDFGLARSTVDISHQKRLTREGFLLGTPDYMAPEQLNGAEVSAATDVYAYGLVLYELVTGDRPFPASTPLQSAVKKLTETPRQPSAVTPDLPPGWDEVVLRCLERRPLDRFHSARELLDALQTRVAPAATFEFDQEAPPAPDTDKAGQPPHDTDGSLAAEQKGPTPSLQDAPSASRPNEESVESSPRLFTWKSRRLAALAGAVALISAIAMAAWNTPAVRKPMLAQACQWWPGSALVCELPADMDLAVQAFAYAGAEGDDAAFADGLAQHLMAGFYRLAPDKDSMCVHIRDDRSAFGMKLVMTGRMETTPEKVRLFVTVRDAATQHLLRDLELEARRSDAAALHAGLLRKLLLALDLEVPPEAWQTWSRTGTSHPQAFQAYLRGLGYRKAEAWSDASRAFDEAIGHDLTFELAHAGLGDVFRLQYAQTGESGWAARARNAFQAAENVPGEVPETLLGLGQLEISQENYEEGIRRFQEALDLEPYDFDARRKLASAFQSSRNFEEAERTNFETAQQRPDCWYGANHLGLFYVYNGRFALAERHFLEVVRLASDNGAAYNNLAFLYTKQGRFPDAISYATKAIELGEEMLGRNNLGSAYYYVGCYEEAAAELEAARRLDETEPRIYSLLGETYRMVPAWKDRAPEFFRQAVELSRRRLVHRPDDLNFLPYLALNLSRIGEHAKAVAEIAGALRIAPDNPELRFVQAVVDELVGDRRAALAALRQAFEGGYSVFYVRSWLELAGLVRDPEFEKLLSDLKLDARGDAGSTSILNGELPCPAARYSAAYGGSQTQGSLTERRE